MLDVEILLQKCDVGLILNRLGIDHERRQNNRGYELYFCCPTKNHSTDPDKKRCSAAEVGRYKGFFNCWACDFHGNLIHLIKYITGWGFKKALEFFEQEYGSADVAGIEALNFRLKMNKTVETRSSLPVFTLPDDYKALTSCQHSDAKRAMKWLTEERHISYEMMDKYQIGFSRHEKLGPTIVMPVMFKGNIHSVFWAQPFKGGEKRYPKGSPQGEILFNYDQCLESKTYIMMESILDVVKYESVIGGNAMACFTNMISVRQLALLRDFDEHGVMPDLDGHRGWDLVERMLPYTGKSLWLYFVPIGKDPGDCLPNELADAANQRTRYCDYELAQQQSDLRPNAQAIKEVRKK